MSSSRISTRCRLVDMTERGFGVAKGMQQLVRAVTLDVLNTKPFVVL